MRSARAVLVVDLDLERPPQTTALRTEVSARRPLHQAVGDQHFDVANEDPLVGLRVLPSEVGVDRHLGASASGNWRDEVQGGRAALAPQEIHGGVV